MLSIVTIFGTPISRFRGGAGSMAITIAKALHRIGLNVMFLDLCFENCSTTLYRDGYYQIELPFKDFPQYFLNYLGQDNIKLLNTLNRELLRIDNAITFIACDPISLFYLLRSRKNAERTLRETKIKIFWCPGGNELTCPLHTEVCPYTNSSIAKPYGHATTSHFFISKCVPHILRSRGLNIYSLSLWPWIRSEITKNVDGILASRSVYLEGCKLLNLDKCAYIGFGIDTEKFTPRNKRDVFSDGELIKLLHSRTIYGDISKMFESVEKNQDIVIGYIGATDPKWKNIELLLKTFNKIARRYDNIRMLIVARNAYLLKHMLNTFREDILNRIVIVDSIPYIKIEKIYNIIDIFINPSLLDSLEVNTLEALSSGNIVLASNRGCIDDLNYLGINLVKFEPTLNSLLTVLENVIKDLDLYRDMYMKNLNIARKALNLDTFGKRILRALRRCS